MEAYEAVNNIKDVDKRKIIDKLEGYSSDLDDEMSRSDWFLLGYHHAMCELKSLEVGTEKGTGFGKFSRKWCRRKTN